MSPFFYSILNLFASSNLDYLSLIDIDDCPEEAEDPGVYLHTLKTQDRFYLNVGRACDFKDGNYPYDLFTAFRLLRCCEETLECGSLESSPVEKVVNRVACDYIRSISCRRKDVVYALTVPGTPWQVIPRKCSRCRRRVLDGAFPEFKLKNRNYYVVKGIETVGCGCARL